MMYLTTAGDFLAQTPDTFPGLLTLINLGVLGITFILFATAKIYPASIVEDLRGQLREEKLAREAESKDAKAVRDVIIRDVAPSMILSVEQSKEISALTERLLAIVVRWEGK
jgi:hypothetical protein